MNPVIPAARTPIQTSRCPSIILRGMMSRQSIISVQKNVRANIFTKMTSSISPVTTVGGLSASKIPQMGGTFRSGSGETAESA